MMNESMSTRSVHVARAVWLVLAVAVPVVLVVGLASRWNALQTICHPNSACAQFQLDASAARSLRDHGISLSAYAIVKAATMAVALLIWYGLAALLVWRKPEDRGALLAAFFLVVFPAWGLGAWISPGSTLDGVLNAVFLPTLLVFALLFPDGRFAPRWTRWLVVTLVLVFIMTSLPLLPAASPIAFFLFLVILAIIVAVPVVQIYRYRSISSWVQRQQTKWTCFGLVVAILGFVAVQFLPRMVAAFPTANGSLYAAFAETGGTMVFSAIPVSIAIAVSRYRLWEIDLIINRTLVYLALTTSVIGLYVATVVGLGALSHAQGNTAFSVLATALVAILFQPLRERLQRGVNRLMYGERDDPYGIVSRLGQRLEATLAPGAILPTIVETVAEALRLPYVAIALKNDETVAVAAACGSAEGQTMRLPLVYQGDTIGQLIVSPRTGTRTLDPADVRLLNGLARQAGIAAHAVRLTADLQRSRERLVIAREEERRRLRRDLHDELGPTLAGFFQRLDVAGTLVPRDPNAAVALLDDLKSQVKATIADIRRLVYALRPPALDEYGLVTALREHALQYNGANGVHVSIQAPEPLTPLPAAAEVAAYRIALEALSNVARHAHAQSCSIRLSVDGDLCLEITDDGVGLLAPYRAGVGITSMRERAAELGGECIVEPSPTGGTRVVARIPISKE
jgi:signal transduction histidine kinase